MLSSYGYWPHYLSHWSWADWHRSQGGFTLYMQNSCDVHFSVTFCAAADSSQALASWQVVSAFQSHML